MKIEKVEIITIRFPTKVGNHFQDSLASEQISRISKMRPKKISKISRISLACEREFSQTGIIRNQPGINRNIFF